MLFLSPLRKPGDWKVDIQLLLALLVIESWFLLYTFYIQIPLRVFPFFSRFVNQLAFSFPSAGQALKLNQSW